MSVQRIVAILAIGAVGCGSHAIKFQIQSSDATHSECGGQVGDGAQSGTTRAWAIGSLVTIQLFGADGLGPRTVSGKLPIPTCEDRSPPQNTKVTETNSAAWKVAAGPDANNLVTLRAVGSGTGGIHATSDNAEAADLTLRAAPPAGAIAVWAADYPAMEPRRTLARVVMAASTYVSVVPEVVDAVGNELCVPQTPGSAIGKGVTLSSGAQLGGSVSDHVVLTSGANPVDGSIEVAIPAWSASVPVKVVASAATTQLDVKLLAVYPTGAHVRLRATAGSDEVLGGHVLVENLASSVVELVDAQNTVVSQTVMATDVANIGRVSMKGPSGTTWAEGTARVRFSAPDTTIAPVTLEFTFPNS